eukprot:373210_1
MQTTIIEKVGEARIAYIRIRLNGNKPPKFNNLMNRILKEFEVEEQLWAKKTAKENEKENEDNEKNHEQQQETENEEEESQENEYYLKYIVDNVAVRVYSDEGVAALICDLPSIERVWMVPMDVNSPKRAHLPQKEAKLSPDAAEFHQEQKESVELRSTSSLDNYNEKLAQQTVPPKQNSAPIHSQNRNNQNIDPNRIPSQQNPLLQSSIMGNQQQQHQWQWNGTPQLMNNQNINMQNTHHGAQHLNQSAFHSYHQIPQRMSASSSFGSYDTPSTHAINKKIVDKVIQNVYEGAGDLVEYINKLNRDIKNHGMDARDVLKLLYTGELIKGDARDTIAMAMDTLDNNDNTALMRYKEMKMKKQYIPLKFQNIDDETEWKVNKLFEILIDSYALEDKVLAKWAALEDTKQTTSIQDYLLQFEKRSLALTTEIKFRNRPIRKCVVENVGPIRKCVVENVGPIRKCVV